MSVRIGYGCRCSTSSRGDYPKTTIIGAHLGNPDYAWAGEIGRWNPNLYFDLSGSTLIKKQEDYDVFQVDLLVVKRSQPAHAESTGQRF